jgi:hypothetical protein
VIDPDGVEWLTVHDAARAVRVRPETIRVWIHRGKVLRYGDLINMPDVYEAEYAWRVRLAKTNDKAVIYDQRAEPYPLPAQDPRDCANSPGA